MVDLTPGVVVITAIQLSETLGELSGFVVALRATIVMRSGAGLGMGSAVERVIGSV